MNRPNFRLNVLIRELNMTYNQLTGFQREITRYLNDISVFAANNHLVLIRDQYNIIGVEGEHEYHVLAGFIREIEMMDDRIIEISTKIDHLLESVYITEGRIREINPHFNIRGDSIKVSIENTIARS